MTRQLTDPTHPQLSEPLATGAVRRKVLVVDDHPMTRAGLIQLINKQKDLIVCGEAGRAAEAFHVLGHTQVDLVLADLTLPDRGGIEFIQDLVAVLPVLPILVLSMHDETLFAERALRAGARGYIMKEATGECMLAAIRTVLAGHIYLSPRMGATLLNDLFNRAPRVTDSPIRKLSNREFEVFQLIGQGRCTQEIAQQLHLSPKTVEVHRTHIKEKLELATAAALTRYAVRWVEAEGISVGAEQPPPSVTTPVLPLSTPAKHARPRVSRRATA